MSMKVKTTSKIGSPAECQAPSPLAAAAGSRPLPARLAATATNAPGKKLQVSRTFSKNQPFARPPATTNL